MASNAETVDITSYRRAVVDVFVSHYSRIRSLLKGDVEDFASRAFSAHFISSQTMEFASIFDQFKTGFESCRSILEIQQRYQCFIDILLDIGGPVGDTGGKIKEELVKLTGNHSSEILQKYSPRLSKLVLPVKIVQTLHTEEIISNETFNEVKNSGGLLTEGPLRALSNSVTEDPNQLREFGTVLLQSKDTVRVGQDILREYEFHLQPTYHECFDDIRAKFGILIVTITPLIESAVMPRLKEFKTFLQTCFPELKPQLSTAESFDDVMKIVREKCTMINVACLKVIINHYKIEEAITHITTYKNEVEAFCEEVKLSVCKNENITTNPSIILKCETIEFVLEWEGEEYSLNDIEVLLKKAFEDMAKRVQVRYFKEGNSIIITCYAPQHVMDILMMKAKKNLDQLRGIGLIKLSIGYCTVWDERTRDKEVRELEMEVALLKKKLNSCKQGKEKDVDCVKDTSHKEIGPAKYEREGKEEKLKSTPKEEEVSSSMDKDDLPSTEESLSGIPIISQIGDTVRELTISSEVVTHEMETHPSLPMEHSEKKCDLEIEELKTFDQSQSTHSNDANVPLLRYNRKVLESPPVQTVMSNFNSYKNSGEEWYSPSFLSHSNGYQMYVRIAANGEDEGQGTHLSLYIHLMAGKNDDLLSWPFRGEVKVQLINRRDDHDHYEQNIVFDDSSNVQACSRVINGIPVKAGLASRVGEGKALFISQDKLQTNTSDFLEDDSIIICIKQVIVHSSPSIVPSTSSDPLPVLDFKINNFSKRQQSNKECTSEPFYSHENGYKLSLLVYPKGRSKCKNKYISIFVHLMKGENDDKLTFPFRGDILVQIINWRENKNHAERLVEFNEKTDPKEEYGAPVTGLTRFLLRRQSQGYGYPNFLSHKFLEFDKLRNTQYVSDDDTLHVRIMKITHTT